MLYLGRFSPFKMSGEVSGPCEAVAKALEFILSPEDRRRVGAQRLRMQPEVPERTSALILGTMGRLLGHNGRLKGKHKGSPFSL